MPRACLVVAVAAVTIVPAAALADPVRVEVRDPEVRTRLAPDPDVSFGGAGEGDVVFADQIPIAPRAPTVVVLRGAGDAATGPLSAPEVVRWRGPAGHPLARVHWRSSPRAAVLRIALPRGFRTLVSAGREPLVAEGTISGHRVLVWTAPLSAHSNRDLAAWSLLGWVLHGTVCRAADREVGDLAEWEAAPIPGRGTALVAGIFLLLLWPLTVFVFLRARRRPMPPAEVLARYSAPGKVKSPVWEDPSFARPLGGFFLFLAGSVLLLAPYFWLATVVIPNRVQPFPQADGDWDIVVHVFEIVFFLFDFATNTAFVRFFAASRVHNPERALRYAQLFLWWQVLSGLVQVTAIALFVLLGPFTSWTYGFLAFFFLLHGVVQYPGLFGVAHHLLQGSQRFDYSSAIDVLEKRIFRILVPIPFVLLFRAWGAAHPAYGEAFGAVLGLGVGAYVTQWLTLGVGLALCRRAGLPVRPLFGAAFRRSEVREVFGFGAKAIVGQVAFRASNLVETVVLASLLLNSREWLGIRGLLETKFSYLVLLAYPFFDSGVPVFGEALGAGKRALGQYLVARFLQFGVLWGALLFAILSALGPTFIRGALDPQWHRAAEFVILAAFARALACPGWVSDALQKGANFPLLWSGVLTGEQALKIGLFLVLIPAYQFGGLYAAVILALTIKTVVAWWLNHRLVLPLKLSVWQSLGAPLATGVVVFVALSAAVRFFEPGSSLAAQVVFYGGAILAIGFALFLMPLLGGLDPQGLIEVDRATRMTSVFAPVARILGLAARAGARLSPLHGRFPQPTLEAALREADEIRAAHAQPAPDGSTIPAP